MKHLKYYIYQLLRKIKNKKILLFITFFSILTLIYLFKDFFVFYKEKYVFLVVNIDSVISSDELDIDSLIKEIKNPIYDGIILKISSNGGGIEVIRIVNSLKEINKTKLCYIDGFATSAAYWICSISDYIIARPDSIIGNIGAYITIVDLTNFLRKLGINVTIIKSTPYKDIGTPYRELSNFEREYLENMLRNLTNKFIEDIKSRRDIKDIAVSGLWFLPEDAKKYNLIDEIDEFDRVKNYIAEKFNVSKDSIHFKYMSFRKKKLGIFEILFKLYRILYNPIIKKIFI